MLVYGDGEREVAPDALIASIRDALALAAASRGIVRHGWIAAGLIEAGELAQGVADHAFALRGGVDAPSDAVEATDALVRALGQALARSWTSAFAAPLDEAGSLPALLDCAAAAALPAAITTRNPEGFAHYAVYPEGYVVAAMRLPGDRPVRVIGLRSIGSALAGVAATGLARPAGTVTLRPVGPPFARRISASPDLVTSLVADPEADFAIVDEGPGLSGSSIAAAVTLLEEQGVAAERIHILPSHPGEPGAQASAAVRAAWVRCRPHVVTFDELVLGASEPAHRLEHWCADLIGPPLGPLVEITGGGWRRHRRSGAEMPPVQAGTERRKFLVETATATGTWCLRYAGLGRTGSRKLDLARRLHAAGFVPEPAGFRHGFLVERWCTDARPLDPAADRARLLDHLTAYLACRATLPPGPYRGASAHALLTMARRNAELGLGRDAARALDRWETHLDRLDATTRTVAIDGRLQAWEWLVTPGGTILKTDAVDHHASHDLVGPQGIAWDVAGAVVEFTLSAGEEAALVGQLGMTASCDAMPFWRACYAAFQLGAWTMARDAAGDVAERARLDEEVLRYGRHLAACLQTDRVAGEGG